MEKHVRNRRTSRALSAQWSARLGDHTEPLSARIGRPVIAAYLVVEFFLPKFMLRDQMEMLMLGIIGLTGFMIVVDGLRNRTSHHRTSLALASLALVSTFGIAATLTEYPTTSALVVVAHALFALVFFGGLPESESSNWRSFGITYWFMTASLTWSLMHAISVGEALRVGSLNDKNYSGVVVFLYFMFCYKSRRRLGLVLSAVASIATQSRLSVALLALFILVELVVRRQKGHRMYPPPRVAPLFLLNTLIIVPFSYMWVEVVSASGVLPHQAGLNDTSNRMRFRANLEAIDALHNDWLLLFRGYDAALKRVLGVFDIGTREYARFVPIADERSVQTHHSILNLALTVGVLMTVVYLLVLSSVLTRVLTYRSWAFVLPYVFAGMVMHSLFSQGFMIFWLFVITERQMLPQRVGRFGHGDGRPLDTSGTLLRSARGLA